MTTTVVLGGVPNTTGPHPPSSTRKRSAAAFAGAPSTPFLVASSRPWAQTAHGPAPGATFRARSLPRSGGEATARGWVLPAARRLGARAWAHPSDPVVLREPAQQACDVDDGEVVASRLVIAGGDRATSLDSVEEDLDEISGAVQSSIEPSAMVLARGITGDDDLHSSTPDLTNERVAIVAAIGHDRSTPSMGQQLGSHGHLVPVARREGDVQRPPLRVDDRMDLGGKSSTTSTQSITFDPPFSPAASWCARTTEASMMEPRLTRLVCKALKTCAHRPRRDQLLNRLYTVFQGPKRSGKSRQGIPVLTR